MTDAELLERAWALATLPMAHPSYIAAVHELVADGQGGCCPRALQILELAVEVVAMRGSLHMLLAAWTRSHFLGNVQPRATTSPSSPSAIRGAA